MLTLNSKMIIQWHVPVLLVSVVVLAAWLKFAFCPECPGYVHCPPKSSYTVYTKQCMYKIENLKEKEEHELRHGSDSIHNIQPQ